MAADRGAGIPHDTPEDVTGTEYDFRTARRIGLTELDSALTGLTREADGRVRARLSNAGTQVTLWAGPGYEWLRCSPATRSIRPIAGRPWPSSR